MVSRMVATLSMLLCAGAPAAFAQATGSSAPVSPPSAPRRAPRPVTAEPIAPGVYWVHNVGFAAFLVGDSGVVAVDTGGSIATGQSILAQIAKVTSKPVNVLILSHCDGDHVNGIGAFPASIPVYAQAENKAFLEKAIASGETGPEIPRIPPDHMPNHSIAREEDVTLDGIPMKLLHWAPAHTSGDLVVYLPKDKLVLAGDVLVMDQHDLPLIHQDKGGTSKGWVETVRALLALDANRYVVGHEGLVGKDVLQKQLNAAKAERAEIKELYDKGLSLQAIQANVNDPLPGAASNSPVHFPPYSEVVYNELKNGTY